jgi:hypothetical protein
LQPNLQWHWHAGVKSKTWTWANFCPN